MKKLRILFSFILCTCMVLTVFSSAFTAFATEEEEIDMTVEEPYIEGDTIYDLENEVDTPVLPDEEEPVDVVDPEETDSEGDLYGSDSFDRENAEQLAQGNYVLDEIIIKFKEPWQVPGKEKQLQNEINKVQKVGFVEELGLYVVKVDDLSKNPNAVLNRFKNNKYIEYVEPNYIFTCEFTPNDPNFKAQSLALTTLGAVEGWDIIKGGGPIVAVVDSGVANHPDLPPLMAGYSAVTGLSPNNDKLNHGTGVAGTIGAIGNNGIGGAGINWNASILPVKVDDAAGVISTANLAKGIIWAADNGAKVINLSLGSTADSATMKNAIDYAYHKGCAIFAATGNSGINGISYPARYPNVMAVGSSGNGSTRLGTSNYGAGMGVLANSSYNTTTASGGYLAMSGTSFASPQAAGLATLLWALNPGLTNAQIYDLIQRGAKGGGSYVNDEVGYGYINIANSLRLVTPAVTDPVVPPPETPQEVRTPPTITLTGFTTITLEYGQAYVEAGYKAVDCKGVDLTSAVKITNTVKPTTAGLYTITYDVSDSAGLSAKATRTVTVNEKPADPPPLEAPKITINGSNPIVLHSTSSTPYKEQMARAIDGDGTDISGSVKITSGSVNRTTPGTYKLTYSITSPKSGLTSTATRDVRIVAPTEKKDPRTKYGFSGQAKEGGKITHTGVTASEYGFMDLSVTSIDKNMTISVQLIDTATKKAVLTDTFTAAGKKQYNIEKGKYELAVTVTKANGNSKYGIDLLMPETAATYTFDSPEVPLAGMSRIAIIGSDPIILHVGGTPYSEQGARAVDFMGDDISDMVEIDGVPDTSKEGIYTITYKVKGASGKEAVATREVRVIAPNEFGVFEEEEVPLAPGPLPPEPTTNPYVYIAVIEGFVIAALIAAWLILWNRRKVAANVVSEKTKEKDV